MKSTLNDSRYINMLPAEGDHDYNTGWAANPDPNKKHTKMYHLARPLNACTWVPMATWHKQCLLL